MPKSLEADTSDRPFKRKGEVPSRKRRPGEGEREGGETIPSAGKTKARAKAPPDTRAAPVEPRAGKRKPAAGKKARLTPRKAFLVAVTLGRDGHAPNLRVYAAVVRSAEAALASVRAEIGEAAAVELTGSLSTRMAKTLGLKPDEIRQI